jgi:steroid delta-isomerase-like uncharacterized protein
VTPESPSQALFVRIAFEAVWDDGDVDAVPDFYATDHTVDFPGDPGRLSGRDELAAYVADLHDSFADLSVTVDDLVGSESTVAVRFTAAGDLEREHRGIPPTDEPLSLPGVAFVTVGDERIEETWLSLDRLSAVRQTDAVPGELPSGD